MNTLSSDISFEEDLPAHPLCDLCKKTISYKPYDDKEYGTYDRIAQYICLSVQYMDELDGPRRWEQKAGEYNEFTLCPECGKKLRRFLKEGD